MSAQQATATATRRPPAERGRLALRGAELISALATLLRTRRGGRRLHLTFDDGMLSITRAETTVRVSASGHWPDHGLVDVRLASLLLAQPKEMLEEATIVGDSNGIHLGYYTLRCTWLKRF